MSCKKGALYSRLGRSTVLSKPSYTLYFFVLSCRKNGRKFFSPTFSYSQSFILLVFQEDFLLFAEIDAILQILEKVCYVLLLLLLFLLMLSFFSFFSFFSFIVCGVPVNFCCWYDLQT